MAYSITGQAGVTTYGVMEYIVNTEADVATVPTDDASGSTIAVIETGNVYMLTVMEDGVKEWVIFGGGDA